MEFFDFGTIFFLIAAVVIFFQLRNVLGRRTGNEKPPFDPYTAGRKREAEAVAKPTGAQVVAMAHQPGARDGTDDYVAFVGYNVRMVAAALQPKTK